MFHHEHAVRGETIGGGPEDAGVGVLGVRRIKHHDVEGGAREIGERARDARANNSIALSDAAVREVVRDELLRAAIAVDERDVRRAAAQRFDADRARAGVAVEDARALDARREDVEQRLAQLVGRGPQAFPRRRFETTPFQRSSYHAHSCLTFLHCGGPSTVARHQFSRATVDPPRAMLQAPAVCLPYFDQFEARLPTLQQLLHRFGCWCSFREP